MSDSEPDLYSFLQSRDFGDEQSSETESEVEAEVETVDSFTENGTSDVEQTFGYGFGDEELGEILSTLSEDALDNAPFGIIQVDDDGLVQFYNQYEARLAEVDPEDAVGRNFFTQLAPCSSNRLFHGRFEKGVQRGTLDEQFTYTFTYKMKPTLVQVRMYRDQQNKNWIMIRKQT
jgi:photoactive yellow protein